MVDEILVLGVAEEPQLWLQNLFRQLHCKLLFSQIASFTDGISFLATGPESKAIILQAETSEFQELSAAAITDAESAVFWAVPQLDEAIVSKAIEWGAAGILSVDMSAASALCLIRIALSNFNQTMKYKALAEKAVRDLTNRKQIERAKGILMERFGLSENDAFQQIRREAMNRRVSMAQLAESIVLMEGLGSEVN